jgi:4-hydroxy-3-polyprenylbenzoate decarboxylase
VAPVRLPTCYDVIDVEVHDQPISADLELTRWMADEEIRRGRRPTVLYDHVVEYPGEVVLANPYPRAVLLAALGVDEADFQPTLEKRLRTPGPGVDTAADPPADRAERGTHGGSVGGLGSVPAIRHRPGDAGRYLTAAVTVTQDPETGDVNLGVYRVQVIDDGTARVFFDPRTHAHANLQAHLGRGRNMPVAMFLGADPVFVLVAASSLPRGGNDFDVAARLAARRVTVAGDPPAPVDAGFVIRGEVTAELAPEGPFGEFKGFYVDARPAPILRVEQVQRRPGAVAPTVVTGRESGLSLTAVQNEYLLYAHLVAAGFPVTRVRCPPDAFGEFLTLVETTEPSADIVRTVMERDVRTKVVIAGADLRDPWRALSTHGFQVHRAPYMRKGRVEGERVGLVLDIPPDGKPVEW